MQWRKTMNSKRLARGHTLASTTILEALNDEELRSIEGGGIVQPSLVLIGRTGGSCIFRFIDGYAVQAFGG